MLTTGVAHAPLAQFILSLTQALLRAGSYTAERPAGLRAVRGLYAAFQTAMRGRRELTLVGRQGGGQRTILIDGFFETPIPISRVLKGGMADLCVPNLLDYFDRRRLVQFTLKTTMTADEFQAFIAVMSAPPDPADPAPASGGSATSEAPETSAERTSRALVEAGVLHASTVFMADLVAGERTLPCEVETALSRLKKDLRILTLCRTLTPDRAAQMKQGVLDDILRPIRTPGALLEFLVNADAISAGLQETHHLDLEAYLVGVLSPQTLRLVAAEGLKALDSSGSANRPERVRAVLKRLASVLAPVARPDDFLLFRHLLDRHVIMFDFLPPAIKEQVTVERLADEFLADHGRALAVLKETSGNAFADGVSKLVRLAPELIRRHHYRALLAVMEWLDEVRRAGPVPLQGAAYVAHLAREQLVTVANASLLAEMLHASRAAPPEALGAAIEALVHFGRAASAPLVTLTADETADVRESACRALIQLGEPALGAILDGLRVGRGDRRQVAALLSVIGAIGVRRQDILKTVEINTTHPQAEVRAEALATLTRLQWAGAERYLLKALQDAALSVQEAAVAGLGRFRCVKRPVIAFYVTVLKGTGRDEAASQERLQLAVCRAIRGLAPALSPESALRLAAALRDCVQARTLRVPQWLGRLFWRRHHWTEPVKAEARVALDSLTKGADHPRRLAA